MLPHKFFEQDAINLFRCRVERVYYFEQRFILWNVGHRRAVMSIPDEALSVNDGNQRHASHFENIDLLLVAQRRGMIRIGQTDKREFFRLPIDTEGLGAIRTDGQDFCAATRKLIVFIAQARQLRAAVRSEEAS
jgi:hypothetical protein